MSKHPSSQTAERSMDQLKQRIAIAEACGWRRSPEHDWCYRGSMDADVHCEAWLNGKTILRREHLPDYLNDLNAMHEAEEVGQALVKGFWTAYTAALKIAGAHQIAHATAAQRAEAFLKAIGKWEE
jgi:hypothetical protein